MYRPIHRARPVIERISDVQTHTHGFTTIYTRTSVSTSACYQTAFTIFVFAGISSCWCVVQNLLADGLARVHNNERIAKALTSPLKSLEQTYKT